MLQDVKKGWLQKEIRDLAPEQHYEGKDDGTSKLVTAIGATHEFKTVDGLVEFAVEEYIAEQHRESGLIAICGEHVAS